MKEFEIKMTIKLSDDTDDIYTEERIEKGIKSVDWDFNILDLSVKEVLRRQKIPRVYAYNRIKECIDNLNGKEFYPDEISDMLELDFELVMSIISDLIKEDFIGLVDEATSVDYI